MLKIRNFIQNKICPESITANMWLDLNETEYEFVDDGPADILLWCHPVTYNDISNIDATIYIYVYLSHADHNKIKWHNFVCTQENSQHYKLLECTDPTINNPQLLSNLFIFNRSKAYYSNRKFKNDACRWYYIDSKDFELQPISDYRDKTKVYLSASKLSRQNQQDIRYRYKIFNLLNEKFANQGYLGNGTLYPNRVSPEAKKVEDINVPEEFWLGYSPVHNAYYNETFISVYGETLEVDTTQIVTEKTYDPLIKGHFILPFSTAGFIKLVKSQGFRLPKFIDYSYDLIDDPDQRWQAYQQELERLLMLDMATWQQHWVDNLDILHYNRQLFTERDYDRIDLNKLLEKHR